MDGACKEWWYKDKVIGVSKNGYLFIAVTFFTTPANRPFISQYLDGTGASIVDLPFPQQVAGVPAGVESTDKLPCMSLFVPFVKATELLQPHLERELQNLPPFICMVSDGFFSWTLHSASKFGVPRLVLYAMNGYATTMFTLLILNRLPLGSESDNEPSTVPQLPWIKLTKNDFEPSFWDANDPLRDFAAETIKSTLQSYGVLVNSFPEVDSLFLDYWNREIGAPKAWCVGPLCLAEPPRVEPKPHEKPTWVRWLDQKLDQGIQVLYVAFGSQADISAEQLQEIATGLEESRANFLWVLRKNESDIRDGFEERVKDRGMVVREWVDQREILSHEAVQGFLSHCGWNSVLESICAAVPILAWPMMAEQPLNATLVVEQIKVGLRVETTDGSVRGFVKKEQLEKMVRELMEGEKGEELRKEVKKFVEAARTAMEEGGSSWQMLNLLIDETCKKRGGFFGSPAPPRSAPIRTGMRA